MKGKIRTTTTAQSLTVKGYQTQYHELKGTWVKLSNLGQMLSEYKQLNGQNGFYAAMKRGGTVFVVMTGEDKGIWSKVERD